MQNRAIVAVGSLTILAAACGSAEQPEVVEQIVVRDPGDAAPVLQQDSTIDGSVDLIALGEDAFQICTGCHSAEAGAPSAAGPNLHSVIGRAAGGVEDYSYSDALAQSEIVWDEATLDAYIADPAGTVPGTDMLAGAVGDEEQRAAIIAYLASTSEGS